MKKHVFIVALSLVSILASCSAPTLCECLTAPGGDPTNDKPSGCKDVIEERYGTTTPSVEKMESDYYSCKGN